jgi:hypothetical protein
MLVVSPACWAGLGWTAAVNNNTLSLQCCALAEITNVTVALKHYYYFFLTVNLMHCIVSCSVRIEQIVFMLFAGYLYVVLDSCGRHTCHSWCIPHSKNLSQPVKLRQTSS